MMGMWGPIKYALNSTVGTSNFKPLNEVIGNKNDASSNSNTASLMAWLKYVSEKVDMIKATVDTINTNASRGAVRSIQRGQVTIQPGTAGQITITSVNINKCMINVVTVFDANTNLKSKATLTLTSSTLLTYSSGTTNLTDPIGATTMRWELIEFY